MSVWTRKNVKYVWTEPQKRSFEELKTKPCESLILTFINEIKDSSNF